MYQSASGTRVSWVLSASGTRVSWGLRMLDCLQSAQVAQNFGYLFVGINKSVRNAASTE